MGYKIDPKTTSQFKSVKVVCWDRLGSILARFWIRLGVKNGGFLLENIIFRENRRLSHQDASKSDLGPKMKEKGSQKGAKMRPNLDPRDLKIGVKNEDETSYTS